MKYKLTTNLIVESNEIKDILKYCSFDTLALFDLDNTLIRPKKVKGLGGDSWFSAVITHAKKVSPDKETARMLSVELCNHVQDIIEIRPVEGKTAKILQSLKDVGLPIMGLTAREVRCSETTEKQLKSANIAFSKLKNGIDEIELDVDIDVSDRKRNPCYKNGIIYCDGLDKGKCLAAFLALLKPKYSVVMVDDMKHNLEKISAEANAVNFSFVGLRYGHTDQLVSKFRMSESMVKMKERINQFTLDGQIARVHEIMIELKLSELELDCDKEDDTPRQGPTM